MTTKVIAIVNQKGGSGKTTVSMQLAGSLARRNQSVLVIDADPQATATRCAAAATDENPFPAAVVGMGAANSKVHREVSKFMDKYDFIIIDTPPAAEAQVTQSALLIADLALIPVIPSPYDLWATVQIKQAIEAAKTINENLQARLIINQCQPNTTLAKDSIDVLPEFGLDVCKTYLRQRTIYRQSAAFGQSVHQFGKKAKDAISEIEALTNEIIGILVEKVLANKPTKNTKTSKSGGKQ
ncbi:MAG: ParA family protein [Acidobacteria bacterium]|nr:ParA family protein [Acidobacteriota bacterium]